MKNVITKGLAVKLVSGVAALTLVAGVGTACYFGLKQDQNNSNVQPVDVVTSSQPDDAKQEEAEATDPDLKTEDLITDIEEGFVPLDPGVAWYAEEEVKTASGFLENGSFADGMNYWETYSYLEGNIDYSADAENGFKISIANTGTEDWHVQLKQNGINLTKGKWYKITLDAKSSMDRAIILTMQRDGMADDKWTAYSPATRLSLSKNWQTYSIIFQMTEPSDSNSIFNFAMGKVDGVKIAKKHDVCIRNIKMQTLSDSWMDSIGEEGNLIKNGNFEYKDLLWEPSVVAPGMAKYTFENNKVVFGITDPGTIDWHVQLKQGGIPLEKGMGYRLTFNVNSTAARTIKIGFMDKNYVNWYGGADIALNTGDNKAVVEFKMEMENNDDVLLMVSMGKKEGINTPACDITMSDFKLEKVPGLVIADSSVGAGESSFDPFTQLTDGWAVYDHEDTHSTACYTDGVNGFRMDINDTGTEDWHVQLQKKNVALVNGKWYRITFEAMSTRNRTIGYMIQRDGANDNDWTPYSATDGSDKPVIDGEWKTITQDFRMTAASDNYAIFNFSLGSVTGVRITEPHTVWIRNIVLQEIAEPEPEEIEVNTEMLKNVSFDDGSGWNVNKTSGTSVVFGENKVVFSITDPGFNDYDVQLTQTGLSFEKGCKYRFALDASSNVERIIKVAVLVNGTYEYLGGMDIVFTGADTPVAMAESTIEEGKYVFEFVMEKESTTDGMIVVSMGRIDETTPVASVITLSNLSLIKTAEAGEITTPEESEDGVITVKASDTKVTDQSGSKWIVELGNDKYNLDKYVGKKLKVSADLYSGGAYSAMIGSCFTSDKNEWDWTDSGVIEVEADTNKTFELTVDNYRGALQIQIYKIEEGSDVKIKNLKFEEIVEETPEEPEEPEESEEPEEPNQPEEGVIIVKSTDAKKEDENGSRWMVEFTNAQYGLDQYCGKTLKISADLYSEGAFSAMLGACYSESWVWKGADTIEVAPNTTQRFELVVEDFKGASQIQIYYIEEGASVKISNISFEEVLEETPEEPEEPEESEEPEEPNQPEEGVIIVKSTDAKKEDENGSRWMVEFTNAQYGLDQYCGKTLKISADLYSEGAFSAMIGACYSESWAWKGADTIEVAPNTTQRFELVVEDFKGASQIQIYYIEEGASVKISNLKFEEIE